MVILNIFIIYIIYDSQKVVAPSVRSLPILFHYHHCYNNKRNCTIFRLILLLVSFTKASHHIDITVPKADKFWISFCSNPNYDGTQRDKTLLTPKSRDLRNCKPTPILHEIATFTPFSVTNNFSRVAMGFVV